MFIYVGGGGSRTCQTSQAKYSDVQCIKLMFKLTADFVSVLFIRFDC